MLSSAREKFKTTTGQRHTAGGNGPFYQSTGMINQVIINQVMTFRRPTVWPGHRGKAERTEHVFAHARQIQMERILGTAHQAHFPQIEAYWGIIAPPT